MKTTKATEKERCERDAEQYLEKHALQLQIEHFVRIIHELGGSAPLLQAYVIALRINPSAHLPSIEMGLRGDGHPDEAIMRCSFCMDTAIYRYARGSWELMDFFLCERCFQKRFAAEGCEECLERLE